MDLVKLNGFLWWIRHSGSPLSELSAWSSFTPCLYIKHQMPQRISESHRPYLWRPVLYLAKTRGVRQPIDRFWYDRRLIFVLPRAIPSIRFSPPCNVQYFRGLWTSIYIFANSLKPSLGLSLGHVTACLIYAIDFRFGAIFQLTMSTIRTGFKNSATVGGYLRPGAVGSDRSTVLSEMRMGISQRSRVLSSLKFEKIRQIS